MEVCAVDDDYSAYQSQEKRDRADYYIRDFRDIPEVKEMLQVRRQ